MAVDNSRLTKILKIEQLTFTSQSELAPAPRRLFLCIIWYSVYPLLLKLSPPFAA